MNASDEPYRPRSAWIATWKRVISRKNPPWWRKAYSVKIEIALAFSVIIALMLMLGVAFYFSEQRSAFAIDKLLKSDARMADLSLRSALAMLKARDAENNFLLSVERLGVAEARERYVPPMQANMLDMREYLTSVRIISSDPVFLSKVSRIEQQAQQYEDGFLAFVDLYGKPGQLDKANRTRQTYVAASLATDPMLEDLHTMATRRAIQTQNGVERATSITRWTTIATVAIAAALGAIVAAIVSRRITGSVMQLITFSERVASGDFSARAQQQSEHEFAILARAMNQMAQSLETSQAQLLTAARLAGMAEIATNVLHNVGNVLNSVNVSAGMINTLLRTSKVKGLARAVQLMDGHADDLGDFLTCDAKGKLLPAYLRKLAQTLEIEQEAMAEELCTLNKSIDHIKEIVATQQSYAGASLVLESVKLGELMDDALRMNAGALTRHNVGVMKNLADLPALPLDRHRLLQILVNLIGNAKQAMDVANQSPCITLGADLVGERVLRITVADNGEGIAPEDLIRIFSHGFTTRKDGHGFGLHSSVLAAKEMGGSLTARSDGSGQGATFILDIPIDAPEGKQ